jgi:hypothetical protein
MITHVLFGGYNYYPEGGRNDIVEKFTSLDEAEKYMASSDKYYDWWHLVDITSCKVIDRGRGHLNGS